MNKAYAADSAVAKYVTCLEETPLDRPAVHKAREEALRRNLELASGAAGERAVSQFFKMLRDFKDAGWGDLDFTTLEKQTTSRGHLDGHG